MNRSKSYRILILLLFFAFISLVSRSIIYLVFSLAVAFLIILLLSRDKKVQHRRQEENIRTESEDNVGGEKKHQSNKHIIIPIIIAFIGFLIVYYGYSGYHDMESIYHKVGWVTGDESTSLLLFSIVLGVFLLIYGLYQFLYVWLKK
ncbi:MULTISPECIES: hypothetical protein [Bacillaceae]|uniref:Uncharacterized protein n=1 Tax=Evansella alkalicola TaxID=745819 RepID=A0ABS6JU33_9BACI|nr:MULTISPECIES: hypothetical protein [Bacillaceae]MBU9722098.1 hypothetical protein [Bacillus alkalicola]